MIKRIISILKGRKTKAPKEYTGLSDFFLHAPIDEKKKVIIEAARKSNEDQFKILREARLKVKTS